MPAHEAHGRFTPWLAIFKDGPQVCVVEIRKILRIELAPRCVIAIERFAKLAGLGEPASPGDQRRPLHRFLQETIDIFQLFECLPAPVTLPPLVRRTGQPDGESLGKILVRVGLRIPVRQMPHETSAIGLGPVRLGSIFGLRTAKDATPILPRGEPVGMINGVAAFVA